jgi:hypothetical protein
MAIIRARVALSKAFIRIISSYLIKNMLTLKAYL